MRIQGKKQAKTKQPGREGKMCVWRAKAKCRVWGKWGKSKDLPPPPPPLSSSSSRSPVWKGNLKVRQKRVCVCEKRQMPHGRRRNERRREGEIRSLSKGTRPAQNSSSHGVLLTVWEGVEGEGKEMGRQKQKRGKEGRERGRDRDSQKAK